MKIAEKNLLYNKNFEIKGYLYGQKRPPVSNMRFGVKPMSYNGCGLLAVYNSLLLNGIHKQLWEITYHYDKGCAWIWGLWGLKPWRIESFPKKIGLGVKRCKYKNADAGVYIMLVWNKGGGMHYMAIKKHRRGNLSVFNGYKRNNGCDNYQSFEEFIADTGIICLKLVKVFNKEKDI